MNKTLELSLENIITCTILFTAVDDCGGMD